jgi:hypothetical protein
MLTRFSTYAVFRVKPEQRPARLHGGHGAASVIPYMRADEQCKSSSEPLEVWSVLGAMDDVEPVAQSCSVLT